MVKKKRNTKIELPNADAFAVFFSLIGSFIVTLITGKMWILPLGIACMNLVLLMNIVAKQNELKRRLENSVYVVAKCPITQDMERFSNP